MGQHVARHAVGKRGFADALRAAKQPGMGNASAAIGVEQRRFRLALPEQHGRFARVRHRDFGFSLARAHAGLGTLLLALTRKRSRKAVQTSPATVSTSALASMTTQRSGSAFAISR